MKCCHVLMSMTCQMSQWIGSLRFAVLYYDFLVDFYRYIYASISEVVGYFMICILLASLIENWSKSHMLFALHFNLSFKVLICLSWIFILVCHFVIAIDRMIFLREWWCWVFSPCHCTKAKNFIQTFSLPSDIYGGSLSLRGYSWRVQTAIVWFPTPGCLFRHNLRELWANFFL